MNVAKYKGKALITGASSGIGAVYADRLAKRGYDLIITGRDSQKLNELAQKLTNNTGRSIEVIKANLEKPDQRAIIENKILNDENITMLVNNAGLGATTSLIESNIDDLENLININVIALTRLAYTASKTFAARKNGIIINIASIVALDPELLNGVYSGSKAFVLNLSLSMNKELSEKGIQIQAVLPGAIRTKFWERSGLPVNNLPNEIVMSPEDVVDSALVGLDLKELVTIPSLTNVVDWERYNQSREALKPFLSSSNPAPRYNII